MYYLTVERLRVLAEFTISNESNFDILRIVHMVIFLNKNLLTNESNTGIFTSHDHYRDFTLTT